MRIVHVRGAIPNEVGRISYSGNEQLRETMTIVAAAANCKESIQTKATLETDSRCIRLCICIGSLQKILRGLDT